MSLTLSAPREGSKYLPYSIAMELGIPAKQIVLWVHSMGIVIRNTDILTGAFIINIFKHKVVYYGYSS